jgi:hypothetical protein
MRSAWGPLAIVGGAVVVLLAIVLVVRSTQRTDQPAGDAARDDERAKHAERVQQRLKELSGARGHRGASEHRTEGEHRDDSRQAGQIEGGSHIPAPLHQVTPRPRLGAQAPKGRASAPSDMPQGNARPGGVPLDAAPTDAEPDDIPGLAHMALQDPEPDRREAAVTLLGASEDPQVIPVLAQALADKDEDVRMAAVQSLADFTGEAPFEAVEGALNDPSADIRYEALETLTDLDPERARPYLQRALSDPDEEIRDLAESLLEIEDTAQPPPVLPPHRGQRSGGPMP